VQPIDYGLAPAMAVKKVLKKAGMTIKDIDYHEINEAFSAVAIANMRLLDIDPSLVNIHGGAVSLGHPPGVSGCRLLMTLYHVLREKDATIGVASIPNGGGGASAMIIKRLS